MLFLIQSKCLQYQEGSTCTTVLRCYLSQVDLISASKMWGRASRASLQGPWCCLQALKWNHTERRYYSHRLHNLGNCKCACHTASNKDILARLRCHVAEASFTATSYDAGGRRLTRSPRFSGTYDKATCFNPKTVHTQSTLHIWTSQHGWFALPMHASLQACLAHRQRRHIRPRMMVHMFWFRLDLMNFELRAAWP